MIFTRTKHWKPTNNELYRNYAILEPQLPPGIQRWTEHDTLYEKTQLSKYPGPLSFTVGLVKIQSIKQATDNIAYLSVKATNWQDKRKLCPNVTNITGRYKVYLQLNNSEII